MNAPISKSILHDGRARTISRRGESPPGVGGAENTPRYFLGGLCALYSETLFRPRPGVAGNVRRARAFAWGHACAPEADGSAPTDPRAHTFLGRGKRRLAIRDRKCELCWKLECLFAPPSQLWRAQASARPPVRVSG